MEPLGLPVVPFSWLDLARQCWLAGRYLVIRIRVHRRLSDQALTEQCRRGGILLSYWCPAHDLPRDDPERREALIAGGARKYGQPLACGCLVVRELPGYSLYGGYW